MNFFKDMKHEQTNRNILKNTHLHQEIARIYKSNLNAMAVFAKAHNIKSILTVQPTALDKKERTEHELDFNEMWGAHWGAWKIVKTIYPKILLAAKSVAEKQNVLFAEFSDIYDNHSEPAFIDLAHMNDFGQKILGKSFFSKFSREIYNDH